MDDIGGVVVAPLYQHYGNRIKKVARSVPVNRGAHAPPLRYRGGLDPPNPRHPFSYAPEPAKATLKKCPAAISAAGSLARWEGLKGGERKGKAVFD